MTSEGARALAGSLSGAGVESFVCDDGGEGGGISFETLLPHGVWVELGG